MDDLKALKVGVPRASAQDSDLSAIAPPGTRIMRFEDDATTAQAMLSGQVDAIGAGIHIAKQIMEMNPAAHYEIKMVLRHQPNGMALRRGQPDLLQWVNTFIYYIKNNGELDAALPQVAGRPAARTAGVLIPKAGARRAPARSAAFNGNLRMPASDLADDLIITLEGVDKCFGSFQALSNINLQVRRGERIVICGPSGSGKSTLIRCINQLEHHQKGRIVFDGAEVGAAHAPAGSGPARDRHGVPELQPVPPPHRAAELHAGADESARHVEGRGRGAGQTVPRARAHPRAGRQISRPARQAASSSASRSPGRCA